MGIFEYFSRLIPHYVEPENTPNNQQNRPVVTYTFNPPTSGENAYQNNQTHTPIDTTTTFTNSNHSLDNSENAVDLDALIRSAYPSEQGLYPHELLLLHYVTKYTIEQTVFQSFWKDTYGIFDLNSLIDHLSNTGFITVGGIEASVANSKVAELKKSLKFYNLSQSGNKNDLIARLLENIPADQLGSYFTDYYYVLTPKGQQELDENDYIQYVQKHNFCVLSIWDANIAKHNNPELSIRDHNWRALNEECGKHFANHHWGLFRNTRYLMSEQLISEKNFNHALSFMFEVCCCDLNMVSNPKYISESLESLEHIFKYENGLLTLAPGVYGTVSMLAEKLNLTHDDLKRKFQSYIENVSTPFYIFTKKETIEIILFESTGEGEFEVIDIYKNAGQRLRRKYKQN